MAYGRLVLGYGRCRGTRAWTRLAGKRTLVWSQSCYREVVASFGDPEHKRLDAPGCLFIQWIHTNGDVHGLEWHDDRWSLYRTAHQSSLLFFCGSRSYASRRNRGSCAACRIELAWLLYRYARAHSRSYEITSTHLRWHEHMRTARQSALHALRRRLRNFRDGRAV